ncbi:MAG: hypothetical protein ACTHOG_09785 [Marmoricola sp.]
MYSAAELRPFLRARTGVAVVLIALSPALVACGSTSPRSAAQTPATSTVATPSASPSPTRTPTSPASTLDPTDPASWRSGPGFVGPLRVGASARKLRAEGYVSALEPMACGVRWQAAGRLTRSDLFLEFRGGDPDALDAVVAGSRTGGSRYSYKTAEGVGIGTTTARLKEVYGDLAYGRWATNTGYYVGWVRNTPRGSILFNVGSVNPEDHAIGNGSRVTLIIVAASPFKGVVDGC